MIGDNRSASLVSTGSRAVPIRSLKDWNWMVRAFQRWVGSSSTRRPNCCLEAPMPCWDSALMRLYSVRNCNSGCKAAMTCMSPNTLPILKGSPLVFSAIRSRDFSTGLRPSFCHFLKAAGRLTPHSFSAALTVPGAVSLVSRFRTLVAASEVVPAPRMATWSPAPRVATASSPVTPSLAIAAVRVGSSFAMSLSSKAPALPAVTRISSERWSWPGSTLRLVIRLDEVAAMSARDAPAAVVE